MWDKKVLDFLKAHLDNILNVHRVKRVVAKKVFSFFFLLQDTFGKIVFMSVSKIFIWPSCVRWREKKNASWYCWNIYVCMYYISLPCVTLCHAWVHLSRQREENDGKKNNFTAHKWVSVYIHVYVYTFIRLYDSSQRRAPCRITVTDFGEILFDGRNAWNGRATEGNVIYKRTRTPIFIKRQFFFY